MNFSLSTDGKHSAPHAFWRFMNLRIVGNLGIAEGVNLAFGNLIHTMRALFYVGFLCC